MVSPIASGPYPPTITPSRRAKFSYRANLNQPRARSGGACLDVDRVEPSVLDHRPCPPSPQHVIARIHISNISRDGLGRVAHQKRGQCSNVVERHQSMFGRLLGSAFEQFVEMVDA